jgi:hypothetical protein
MNLRDFRERNRAVCRSSECGRPIFFARTELGANMPLDYLPNEHGNVYLEERDGRVVAIVSSNPPADAARYMPHFATCPKAQEHRRRRGAEAT